MKLRLLPREKLVKTGEVDFAEWNYRPFLGRIQRIRFKTIRSLLRHHKYARLLEVGYGSGVFMPTLSDFTYELHGIDIHQKNGEVQSVLSSEGVAATLQAGSIENSSYPNDYFDCVVIVSALEFVNNLGAACEELTRICLPDATILIVTPTSSRIVDCTFQMITGQDPDKAFESRRQELLPTIERYFTIRKSIVKPAAIGRVLPLYRGLILEVRK